MTLIIGAANGKYFYDKIVTIVLCPYLSQIIFYATIYVYTMFSSTVDLHAVRWRLFLLNPLIMQTVLWCDYRVIKLKGKTGD